MSWRGEINNFIRYLRDKNYIQDARVVSSPTVKIKVLIDSDYYTFGTYEDNQDILKEFVLFIFCILFNKRIDVTDYSVGAFQENYTGFYIVESFNNIRRHVERELDNHGRIFLKFAYNFDYDSSEIRFGVRIYGGRFELFKIVVDDILLDVWGLLVKEKRAEKISFLKPLEELKEIIS